MISADRNLSPPDGDPDPANRVAGLEFPAVLAGFGHAESHVARVVGPSAWTPGTYACVCSCGFPFTLSAAGLRHVLTVQDGVRSVLRRADGRVESSTA